MLIRVRGYNGGIKKYLEEGVKNGRDYTRDELDHRVILDGDLDLTEHTYQLIPNNGQDRYLSITLSFFEDEVSDEKMRRVTQEFKEFLMYAYKDEEFNFYAEAHIPKIKQMQDKKTGEMIERKPHIHVVIPRVNLLSGGRLDPVGAKYTESERYLESFQEYINQKYNLVSPRERVRVDPTNASDVLSRYKGDDFNSKNREFKQKVIKDVIDNNITSRQAFYEHVASFGETRVRNHGKDNEYIAVKLPGDKKFTNLKESIFRDDFIVRRELKKPPLEQKIIHQRFKEWPQRSKELKYISKAGEAFRQQYKEASPDDKLKLLADRQTDFYLTHGGNNGLHSGKRQRDNQRSIAETETRGTSGPANGLQSVSGRQMAAGREAGSARLAVLLPADASFQLGQPDAPGRNTGLRRDLPAGGGRRGHHLQADEGRRTPAVPGIRSSTAYAGWSGNEHRRGPLRGLLAGELNLPPYASNPHRAATTRDVERRSQLLLRRHSGEGSSCFSPAKTQWPQRTRSVSSAAAWYLRKSEQNQILPEHRRALRDVDNQFFLAQRLIYRDERLSRTEKTQFISVLTFERMKAHHDITHPDKPTVKENIDMGSEDIRKLIKEKSRTARNSITGEPEKDKRVPPAGRRFSRIAHKVKNQIEGEETHQARQKSLTAADLYTRRSKLSKNVHYKDKQSNRTLFVDTGTAIAVRKEGMSQAALVVALELAKERFGSTLNIKGSADFRKEVIDVVAKNNLDIHFTSKEMNQQLEDRKAELQAERDGQTIEDPGHTADAVRTPSPAQAADAGDNRERSASHSEDSRPDTQEDEPFWRTTVRLEGKLIDHGKAPHGHQKGNEESYFVRLRDRQGNETTHWNADLQDVMKGRRRGQNIALQQKESRPIEVNVRDEKGVSSVRESVRRTWEFTRIPDNAVDEAKAAVTEENRPRQNVTGSGDPVAQILASPVLRSMSMTLEQRSLEGAAPAGKRDEIKAEINADISARFASADKEKGPVELILDDPELRGMALTMDQKMREMKAPIEKLDAVKAEINGEIAARVERLSQTPVSPAAVTTSVQEKTVHTAPAEDVNEKQSRRSGMEKVHEGVLIASGAAPYKFKPDMNKPVDERDDSFYVKLKMDDGKSRTLWGVGLESAVRGLQAGERVKLADMGVESVTWKETHKDGTVVEKTGDRRIWEGTSLTPDHHRYQDNDGPDVA